MSFVTKHNYLVRDGRELPGSSRGFRMPRRPARPGADRCAERVQLAEIEIESLPTPGIQTPSSLST